MCLLIQGTEPGTVPLVVPPYDFGGPCKLTQTYVYKSETRCAFVNWLNVLEKGMQHT